MKRFSFIVISLLFSLSVFAIDCFNHKPEILDRNGDTITVYSFHYNQKVYHGDPRYCTGDSCYHYEMRTFSLNQYNC